MTGSRSRRAALVVVAVTLSIASIGAAHASTRAVKPPSRLLVSGTEYHLTLSRSSIAHGPALIQFLNRGEDDHDLRLRRISDRHSAPGPERTWTLTRPDALSQLRLRLRAGRYRLWCSLPGHEALGMRATLKVSRKRSVP